MDPADAAPAPSAEMPRRKPSDDEIDVYGLTHQGKVRKNNQDHYLICSLRKFMQVYATSLPAIDQLPLEGERLAFLGMVADGVGGGVGGEAASRTAIEAAVEYVAHGMRCYYNADSQNETTFLEALQDAALQCHESVVQRGQEDPHRQGMATTLTLWIGIWPQAYLLQVGDSRCYLMHEGRLRQISRDQTMAQDLIDAGVLTRGEADKTQWAHVLSSAIGASEATPVVTRLDHAWNSVGLLCSDGLTKHVSDERIEERLRTMTSAKQVCRQLLQDALDDGGTDNITIVVGRVVRDDDG